VDTKHRHRRATRRGLGLEPLESRLLLSADLAPAADALAAELSLVPAEHRAVDASEPAPQISMRIAAHEIVFVDGGIAELDRLLADFVGATGADRPVEVVVLDHARDGLAQIGDALATRKGLTAVHILSHGRDGAIELGGTTLGAATLAERADAIAVWAEAFAANGDLLLYGCDVADTIRGEAFLGELARLTGADVAASDDPTGGGARGGDWDLEFATGAIEAALAPFADATWDGLLATEVLDWDDPAVDWPAATIGSNSYPVGGGNVTVTVTDPGGRLNNGSPDDALNDLGGLGAIEQGLYVSSTGFLPGESSTITIDFAHPGGVSNVSFTIFDIDRGGGPNFIDEIQAGFIASGAVTLSIVNGPSNIVLVGGDTVQGTAGSPSNGTNSGNANATFTFSGSGITQISLNYRNAGGATGQSITLHDISFDPTPTASDRIVTTNEDATYTFAAGDFGFADVGGDTLQAVRITQLETAGALRLNGVDVVLNQVVSIADINANRLAFTPAANTSGAPYANFRFEVGDGTSFSAADYQLRVDVTAVNDAPVLAGASDFGALNEDPAANAGTAVSALLAGQITDGDAGALAGIAVTAADNANGTWEYSTNGGGSWAAFGTPSIGAARLLRDSDLARFVPNADWNGTATLSFRAWDRTSGAAGGTADTNANGGTTAFSAAVHTSSITVTAVPDTSNDAAVANEDVPVTVDVLANDSFENAGRTLTAVAGAANGTVGFTPAGAITYTANADWHGSETLTYTVTSNGVTETGTLSITVGAVGDTVNDAATVDEDNAATVNVMVNDNFESPGRTLTAVSAAASGAVAFTAAGVVTYTPDTHWSGTEVLTYTVTSGGVTETGTFTITVTPVADAPTLTVGAANGNEDTAIALSGATALVDTDGSETLSIAVSAIPVGATLTDGANTFTASAGNQAANVTGWNLAALTVTPPANADTDFTLTLTATATEGANGNAAASIAGLAVDVLPVNDAPTAAAPAVVGVVEDVPSPLLGISFGDVDAGAGLVTATFTVAQGTLSATAGGGVAVGGTATAFTLIGTLADVNAFLAGGGLAYTTVLNGNAPVAFTASLNDLGNTGAGGPRASPNANVTLNVIPVNDAPVLGSVALGIDAGGTVVLTAANMSATDVDDAPSSLVFFIASLQNGRFELAGNPGVPVLAFTQGQVAEGQVKFVHTDPLRPPSYVVFVTDGASTVGPGIVALTFRPLVEPGGASKAARDDGGLPSVSFASGTVDTSGAGLSDPFAIRLNRQPVVPSDGGDAAIAEAEAVTPVGGSRLPVGTSGNVFEVRPRGIAYRELGFGEMDKLPTKIPPLDLGLGPQRPHEEPRGLDFALDAVRTAGLVVSVGAVWWAARAAGLVSSLLAITPTWRHLDPLPVLGRDDDETAGDAWGDPVGEEAANEDASASEMFDAKAKRPPSA
jgi:Domain of unknown function (DUF4347)/Cadherin-like/Bacterial Ig domain